MIPEGDSDAFVVGAISDTHGLIRPGALRALQGVGLIVHAGDVGGKEVLATLRTIAPVHAVAGNMDRGPLAARLPATDMVEVKGRQLYLLHDLNQLDLDPAAADIAAVITGHTHCPAIVRQGGVLYLNPGSAGPRRRHPPSVALMRLMASGEISAEIVELDD